MHARASENGSGKTQLVVGNMGDWLSQFPILSTTTQTPPKTLVRRVLLFSGTMRVVLSYPKKVAFNKP